MANLERAYASLEKGGLLEDAHPPFDAEKAAAESARCLFCFDAPCVEACPTGIDIPNFIRKIQTGNLRGSAKDILSANILGGSCARVCPTETLCEEACVKNDSEQVPVPIGQLQRHATDWLFKKEIQLFKRASDNGKKIAVVGAGPASLSCAHRLSLNGCQVDVFEAKERAGGLNEYGIAQYKMIDHFAQKEVEYLLAIGGIHLHFGRALGKNLSLSELRKQYDAVFLGVGLQGVRALGLDHEAILGVENAVDFIEKIRNCQEDPKQLSKLSVGRYVLVIGGGNTAVDIAVQIKKLGAEFVTLVYRRGPEQMSATWKEQAFAKSQGVQILNELQPKQILLSDQKLSGVEFEYTRMGSSGRLEGTGKTLLLQADQVFKAIGQVFVSEKLGADASALEISRGKILVNEQQETSVSGVYAGGDCTPGNDLTVVAVQEGKVAAQAILHKLGHKLGVAHG